MYLTFFSIVSKIFNSFLGYWEIIVVFDTQNYLKHNSYDFKVSFINFWCGTILFRRFFVKSTLPINEDLRKEIGKNLKSSACLDPPVTLFDEAQAQILNIISNTTYPNFLKSDMYLQYIQVTFQ